MLSPEEPVMETLAHPLPSQEVKNFFQWLIKKGKQIIPLQDYMKQRDHEEP